MERNVNSLVGFSMEAINGEIGKVEDFYFNDQDWTIRYLMAKTVIWPDSRKVLISPKTLISSHRNGGTSTANFTKMQIANGEEDGSEKPVSWQQQAELYLYYPWHSLWGTSFYSERIGKIDKTYSGEDITVQDPTNKNGKRIDENQHWWSTLAVNGYRIHGLDGEIGSITDFIIDDQSWQLTYLVVDTNHRSDRKRVMIPVSYIRELQWVNSRMDVNLSVISLKDSKVFEESEFIYSTAMNSVHLDSGLHLRRGQL
jgi:hypothetical protein